MAEGRFPRVLATKSLYELSVSAVADNFCNYKKYLTNMPENVLFDLYYQLYKEKRLCLLGVELCDLKTFARLLKVTNRRIHLLQCFQALMDHGIKIAKELAVNYVVSCLHLKLISYIPSAQEEIINLGLRLGGFLSEAGWHPESEQVLLSCKEWCLMNNNTPENWRRTLDCCHKLLHAQAAYCAFKGARETYRLAMDLIKRLVKAKYVNCNHAALFTEFSVLFFTKHEYNLTYRWSIRALKQLKPSLPPRVTIDVLRQAAKACVMKRAFQKAGLLIRQAVYLAREVFDTDHPKYSDVLMDYGFYLSNYDSILNSITVYKTALNIRKAIFGKTNLHVALAHEDLGYAYYVYEYSTARFHEASLHAGKAIDIMEKLLPADHLMLSAARRVTALILEEIALDNASTPLSEQSLLLKAECLHQSALQATKTAFGEMNVQTAKHYGNLGRLYQSMKMYEKAEAMQLRAIDIKEQLLGPEDYEVGLSTGHLASLYNFHMCRYRDAEKLYHRSIAIALKLYGNSYSGLGYDYKGLLHLYMQLNENNKTLQYMDTLEHWQELRNKHAQSEDPPIDLQKGPQPIEEVIDTFFSTGYITP